MFRDPVHDLAEPRTPSVPADPRPQRESLADLDGGWGGRTGRSPLEIHIERYFSRWLERPGVQEVAINRPGEVALWEGGYWHAHLDPALTRDVIEQLGQLVANRSRKPFNASNVTLSTALPDGTRLEMTGPPATLNNHIYVNLRKHSVAAFTLEQFIEQGYFANTVHMFNMNMTDEQRARAGRQLLPEQLRLWELAQAGRWPEFLKTAVLEYQNILVSGATGSGKTSFIRGLVELIPAEERILTVEDTPEMPLPNHPHCQALFYRREGTSTTAGGSASGRPSSTVASSSAAGATPTASSVATLRRGCAADVGGVVRVPWWCRIGSRCATRRCASQAAATAINRLVGSGCLPSVNSLSSSTAAATRAATSSASRLAPKRWCGKARAATTPTGAKLPATKSRLRTAAVSVL